MNTLSLFTRARFWFMTFLIIEVCICLLILQTGEFWFGHFGLMLAFLREDFLYEFKISPFNTIINLPQYFFEISNFKGWLIIAVGFAIVIIMNYLIANFIANFYANLIKRNSIFSNRGN